MDAALRQLVRCVLPFESGFNPCFSGCRPATGTRNDHQLDTIPVSILVLVDAALRLRRGHFWQRLKKSFNPCFSGCRPATRDAKRRNDTRIYVSILVLVDAALRPACKDGVCKIITKPVSILVLVDAALRR